MNLHYSIRSLRNPRRQSLAPGGRHLILLGLICAASFEGRAQALLENEQYRIKLGADA
jgi:hypothetical protein